MPLPFAPLPHAFPAASASTPSGGVGARSAPRPASAYSQSGGDFRGVEEILDLTKRIRPEPPTAMRTASGISSSRRCATTILWCHEPITSPRKDLELKRRTQLNSYCGGWFPT